MSGVSEGDVGAIFNRRATEATIQTDLVVELTLANSRRNVSSCARGAPRRLSQTPLKPALFPPHRRREMSSSVSEAPDEGKVLFLRFVKSQQQVHRCVYCNYVGSYPSLPRLPVSSSPTGPQVEPGPVWLRLPLIWRHAGEKITLVGSLTSTGLELTLTGIELITYWFRTDINWVRTDH